MSRRYKNFIQSLKNMRLEDINDIDITADELNEEDNEQYNEENNEFQSHTMGKNTKTHRSFKDHTQKRGKPERDS